MNAVFLSLLSCITWVYSVNSRVSFIRASASFKAALRYIKMTRERGAGAFGKTKCVVCNQSRGNARISLGRRKRDQIEKNQSRLADYRRAGGVLPTKVGRRLRYQSL